MIFRSVGSKGFQAIVLQGESNIELWDWNFRNLLLAEDDERGLLNAVLMNDFEKLSFFNIRKGDENWNQINQKCIALLQSTLSIQPLYLIMHMEDVCLMRNRICLRYLIDKERHQHDMLKDLYSISQSQNQDIHSYLAEIDKKLAICRTNGIIPDYQKRIFHLINGLKNEFDEYKFQLENRMNERVREVNQSILTPEEAYDYTVQDICKLYQYFKFHFPPKSIKSETIKVQDEEKKKQEDLLRKLQNSLIVKFSDENQVHSGVSTDQEPIEKLNYEEKQVEAKMNHSHMEIQTVEIIEDSKEIKEETKNDNNKEKENENANKSRVEDPNSVFKISTISLLSDADNIPAIDSFTSSAKDAKKNESNIKIALEEEIKTDEDGGKNFEDANYETFSPKNALKLSIDPLTSRILREMEDNSKVSGRILMKPIEIQRGEIKEGKVYEKEVNCQNTLTSEQSSWTPVDSSILSIKTNTEGNTSTETSPSSLPDESSELVSKQNNDKGSEEELKLDNLEAQPISNPETVLDTTHKPEEEAIPV